MNADTTDPEYAARKWLSDCLADEASTVIDLLDELDQLRESAGTLVRSISPLRRATRSPRSTWSTETATDAYSGEAGMGRQADRFCRTVTAPRVRAAIETEELPGGFSFERAGRKLDRDAILELEREVIVNLILQTDATGTGRGLRRVVGGEYVIAYNTRGEAICLCWNGRHDSAVNASVLREMYLEVDRRSLKRPLRVYGTTCQIGETATFRFCQIPDEILMRLSAAEELIESETEISASPIEAGDIRG